MPLKILPYRAQAYVDESGNKTQVPKHFIFKNSALISRIGLSTKRDECICRGHYAASLTSSFRATPELASVNDDVIQTRYIAVQG